MNNVYIIRLSMHSVCIFKENEFNCMTRNYLITLPISAILQEIIICLHIVILCHVFVKLKPYSYCEIKHIMCVYIRIFYNMKYYILGRI